MRRLVQCLLLVGTASAEGAPAPLPRPPAVSKSGFWEIDFAPLAKIDNRTFICTIDIKLRGSSDSRQLFFQVRAGKVYEAWLRRFPGGPEDIPALEGMPAAQGIKLATLKHLDNASVVDTNFVLEVRRACGFPVSDVTVHLDDDFLNEKCRPIVKRPRNWK